MDGSYYNADCRGSYFPRNVVSLDGSGSGVDAVVGQCPSCHNSRPTTTTTDNNNSTDTDTHVNPRISHCHG